MWISVRKAETSLVNLRLGVVKISSKERLELQGNETMRDRLDGAWRV